jgi:hypothetical protein
MQPRRELSLSVTARPTVLLFTKRLDEAQASGESKAAMLGVGMDRRICPQ